MKVLKIAGILAVVLTTSAASALEFSGEVGATTDYVFRGTSQNDEDATGFAGVAAESASGWQGSLWTARVDDGTDSGNEIDIKLGWSGVERGVNYEIGRASCRERV